MPRLLLSAVFTWVAVSAQAADKNAAGTNAADTNAAAEYVISAPPQSMELDPFYKKYISANGYPIVGSEKVNNYALKEAAFLINMMIARRPDLRDAMIKSGSRMSVMAYDEFTTNIPEHSLFNPKDYWDVRARGLGGSRTDPVCTCGEENLLSYPGDPYKAENILIHEFAHNIHLRGIVNVDPTFDGRLKQAWQTSIDAGLWKGKYASTNHNEYFAEGVQSWFNNNRPPDHDHNHVDTRAELREYDPKLAALCEEVFGDTEFAYTRPETRLTGHLAGYRPSEAPTFEFPHRLRHVQKEIRRKATNRAKRPPNIVFIMVDDLGWSDLACQGNPLVDTPNLDRLAAQGMRFTDNYAAAPVCSPTRAAVLTGKSPARLRITNHIPDRPQFTPEKAVVASAPMIDRLALDETTIAERLKAAGYVTGFFGKWHLSGGGSGDPDFFPNHQGFDVNIGGCGFGGPPTFFDPYRIPTINDRQPGEYLPDRLADEASQFIETHRNDPFLVFLWNYTVHWPMEAPSELLEKYQGRIGPGLNDTRYGAMIEAMDASIGRVLAQLDRLKLRDETLVIFTSDNGGFGGVSDNRPLRASKGHLYEGGIRVPLIVRWPGVVEPGTTCNAPVVSMDFYPTLLDAAFLSYRGNEAPDGTSLLPLLHGAEQLDRDAIYFHFPNYAWHRSNRLGSAVRSGKYKLIERFDDGSVELFDLESDLSEKTDLAAKMPDLAESLRGKLTKWRTEVNAAIPKRLTTE